MKTADETPLVVGVAQGQFLASSDSSDPSLEVDRRLLAGEQSSFKLKSSRYHPRCHMSFRHLRTWTQLRTPRRCSSICPFLPVGLQAALPASWFVIWNDGTQRSTAPPCRQHYGHQLHLVIQRGEHWWVREPHPRTVRPHWTQHLSVLDPVRTSKLLAFKTAQHP